MKARASERTLVEERRESGTLRQKWVFITSRCSVAVCIISVDSDLWWLCVCKDLWSTEIRYQTWSKVCSNSTLDLQIATCPPREEVSGVCPLINPSQHKRPTERPLLLSTVSLTGLCIMHVNTNIIEILNEKLIK